MLNLTQECQSVANYIIETISLYNSSASYENRIVMTCKRLQKLLYFSDIEFMKQNNGKSMFADDFYAWPSGPIIPSIYNKFMKYQIGEMRPVEGTYLVIASNMKQAIDNVLMNTQSIDTLDLINYSHIHGGPWSHAYDADDVDHEQIISKKKKWLNSIQIENCLVIIYKKK